MRYYVTLKKSYVKVVFGFDDFESAGIFISTVLNTYHETDEDAKEKEKLTVTISTGIDKED